MAASDAVELSDVDLDDDRRGTGALQLHAWPPAATSSASRPDRRHAPGRSPRRSRAIPTTPPSATTQNATFDPDLAAGYYITVTSQSTDIEQRVRQLQVGLQVRLQVRGRGRQRQRRRRVDGLARVAGTIYAIRDDSDTEMDATDAVAADVDLDDDRRGTGALQLHAWPPAATSSASRPDRRHAPGRSPRRSRAMPTTPPSAIDAERTFDPDLATGGYYITVTQPVDRHRTTSSATTSRAPSPASSTRTRTPTATSTPLDGLAQRPGTSTPSATTVTTEMAASDAVAADDRPRRRPTRHRGTTASRLAPGSYFICESPRPAARTWTQSSPQSGDTDYTAECDDAERHLHPDLASGRLLHHRHAASRPTSNNEFGNYKSGSKSGFKYEDENANGDIDAASTISSSAGWNDLRHPRRRRRRDGMPSTRASCPTSTSTRPTRLRGNYSFSLAPGSWFICESAQNSGSRLDAVLAAVGRCRLHRRVR